MSSQKLLAFSKALSLSCGFINTKSLQNLSFSGEILVSLLVSMRCVSFLCRDVVWT